MKIGKLRVSKKAVSPVIATLLMIAVAVAASVIVYVWSAGLLGTLMGGGGSQVKEQLIVEAYSWPAAGTFTLNLRNTGSSSVIVDKIYVGGTSGTVGGTTTINPGESQAITVTALTGLSLVLGTAYTVKIVTKTGGVFSYSCIYGSSG